MYTRVKTKDEIKAMRKAGIICAEVLAYLKHTVKAGMSTKELADIAAMKIKEKGGFPAFLGYQGFPETLCISLNEEVVHGIPTKDKIIKQGDIASFDMGVIYGGMVVDSAISVLVESSDVKKRNLIRATRDSLSSGLRVVKDGCKTGDIGAAIEKTLKENKLGIVRDLVGHGVGHTVHEDPNIPNFGQPGTGAELKAGMTVAIEPMATVNGEAVFVDSDKWTVKTADNSLSAHFEQTILIKQNGYDVLTPFL